MKAVTLLMCLVGTAYTRPLTWVNSFGMASMQPAFPMRYQDQLAQQPQPQIPPQLYSQFFPAINYLPPSQQTVPSYLPESQLLSPLPDTDVQPQMYAVFIQQPQIAGSVSSEEAQQQRVVYTGFYLPVVPGGTGVGITQNQGGGLPEVQEMPLPEGILPNLGNPINPFISDNTVVQRGDTAQGSSHPIEMPAVQRDNRPIFESTDLPARGTDLAGVQQATTGPAQSSGGGETPAGFSKTSSFNPPYVTEAHFVEPVAEAFTIRPKDLRKRGTSSS
ncbi:uncharacterized protein LOC121297231 [Polyodon spathula]|uniref:uncharacterized protein LOC121297231 n=1 Tax=Polyodon spathula TaxID=7913 RepID=UPI001B7F29F3|nr:uncharacterized protein LOC121297231 [Polyodon spathula]XP_041079343.1 uncharacterized protein LOC121297231 [Polyodon spathula]